MDNNEKLLDEAEIKERVVHRDRRQNIEILILDM